MYKDFDRWNTTKKRIDNNKRIDIRKKSVWICSFGLNIGYEIDGKNDGFERPALVIKSFGRGDGIVLPLTSKNKKGKYLVLLNEKSYVNITQIKYLDSKRFKRFLFEINNTAFEKVRFELKKLL